jgi:anti-sigma factor RsiW
VLVSSRSRLRVCASPHLRARCAAHRAIAGTSRAGMFSRVWLPLSLAATVLLALAGVFLFGVNDPVEALAAQLAIDHVTCFQFPPSAVVDPGEVGKDWARSQGWPLHVPASSAAAGLQLIGLRRCRVSEGRTAHVMYKWRGQPLSVFVLPRTLQQDPRLRQIVEKFGHESIVWSDRGRTYVVVVRGHPNAVEPVVEYLKANTQ